MLDREWTLRVRGINDAGIEFDFGNVTLDNDAGKVLEEAKRVAEEFTRGIMNGQIQSFMYVDPNDNAHKIANFVGLRSVSISCEMV